MKKMDLTNKRFGRLIALTEKEERSGGHILWHCLCDCGKTVDVVGTNLIHGHTKSCGCLSVENARNLFKGPEKVASMASLYRTYRISARKRNLVFSIDKDNFYSLVIKPCHYCGAQPTQVVNYKNNGDFLYNGLDRLNSSRGYTLDNVVTCCKTCNYAKRSMTVDEFSSWINRVYDNWSSHEHQ